MAPKLAIIAGGGALPRRLREMCLAADRDVLFLALDGHFNDHQVPAPDATIKIGEWATAFKILNEYKIEELVFAGDIRRPSIKELKPDARCAMFLARVGRSLLGDNSILSAVMKELEKEGFKISPPESFLADFLVKKGVYGAVHPDETATADIKRGREVIAEIGVHDIGQAVVVQQGIVLAVEAAEGTDSMIRRCKTLLRSGGGGVLIKFPKPGQDRRVDLPTIGPMTVSLVREVGLVGIAVAAGGAIVIDSKETVKAADNAGIFIVGVCGD